MIKYNQKGRSDSERSFSIFSLNLYGFSIIHYNNQYDMMFAVFESN